MSRRTLAILTASLAVITIFFAILWTLAERRCQERSAAADELSAIRENNQALHDSLRVLASRLSVAESTQTSRHDEAARDGENQVMLLTQTDIRRLKKLGLSDPVTELRRDLVAHPELIPYEGVLGGTMHFIGDRVALLTTRWVFAEFEDGHIWGVCLLEYEVTPGGKISWKVLAAELP